MKAYTHVWNDQHFITLMQRICLDIYHVLHIDVTHAIQIKENNIHPNTCTW